MIGGTIPETMAGQRVDAGLAALHPDLSRARIQALIRDGAVRLGGAAVTRPSTPLVAGQAYVITLPDATPSSVQPEAIALNVVYEDAELIVVDKPAGLVVHPAVGHAGGTLVNALLHHCHGQLSGIGGVARPGIVHRIDKDTSGLLVAAKTDRAHAGLAQQFAAHSIDRQYRAIVRGLPVPASGTVRGNIGRSPRDRKQMAIVADGQGKPAVTHYALMEPLRAAAMIACRLETGRTHQVRVHMASIGHALLGDPLYARRGGPHAALLKQLEFQRQALHAERLGFVHPVSGAKCDHFSPIPRDMMELLEHIRV